MPFTASSLFSTERRHFVSFVKQIISDKVTKAVVLALELPFCSQRSVGGFFEFISCQQTNRSKGDPIATTGACNDH